MHLRKYMKCIEIIVNRQKCYNWCQISLSRRYFSSDDNKDNDNKSPEEINEKIDDKNELSITEQNKDKVLSAKQKLSNLLNQMKVDSSLTKSESIISKSLAKPKTFIRKSAREEETLPQQENIDDVSKGIDKRLEVAAKVIANTLSGSEAEETESELLELLRLHAKETIDAKNGKFEKNKDLASVFTGMKVEKSRAKRIRESGDYRSPDRGSKETGMMRDIGFATDEYGRSLSDSLSTRVPHSSSKDKVNIYMSEPLGIFDENMTETSDAPKMYIWNRLMKEEVERTVIQAPSNAFEEMIQWTEEGKLWKYPIDNEQGLEEEQNVPFYEHVLLDHLLEGFPEKGPVRQFMELVLMGLSKNPYITVERKHATVEYYRQYFNEKEDLLRASGALG